VLSFAVILAIMGKDVNKEENNKAKTRKKENLVSGQAVGLALAYFAVQDKQNGNCGSSN
jgi:hypothetical protein